MLSDFIAPYPWGASFVTRFSVWPHAFIGASHVSFHADQRLSSGFCIVRSGATRTSLVT